MLSIAHATTGAFIAAKLPHPLFYIPLTLAAHYLQDWTPHWDVGTGLTSGKRKRKTAVVLELVELGLSIGLIYWWFQKGQSPVNYHIWLAALVGIIPDLIEAPRNFLRWEPSFLKPLNQFHGKFHHSTHNKIIGLLPQVVVLLTIWWLK